MFKRGDIVQLTDHKGWKADLNLPIHSVGVVTRAEGRSTYIKFFNGLKWGNRGLEWKFTVHTKSLKKIGEMTCSED